MRAIAFSSLLLVLAGCSSPRVPSGSSPSGSGVPWSQARLTIPADLEGQFFLSMKQTDHALARVRLISVAQGGTTLIEHLDTHQQATALPGEYFSGPGFGSDRLKLIAA